ncbi:MerR family transcriptional regulator [Pectinatus brassicae]|uniref:Effector-binding domain-containing protein n=1 Tax=Pectinatus brassicae TaxID=862415 RepID=A0A840UWQ1_9FIRM|nr:MerR family transcriptional regulator [Pectinatus brassicae]MBB5337264.1 effector-binding domain-containing protein [Pectinatus brassicae]
MKELFTIGEVSRLFHIKIETLRYYDSIGLLKPQETDEQTKYRYYSTGQFERLNSIKYLRTLDMPIKKIMDFFNYREIDTLTAMLKEQKETIACKKQELENVEKRIDRRLQQIEDALSISLNKIEKIELPEWRAVYLRRDYMLGDDIEYRVSELIENYGINGDVFLGKIGISIAMEDLHSSQFNKYSGIFMIIEDEDKDNPAYTTFPKRKYLRIRFNGSHMNAAPYYKKLLQYLKQHNMQLIDNSIETALIDYGVTNDLNKYVTQILLPYK